MARHRRSVAASRSVSYRLSARRTKELLLVSTVPIGNSRLYIGYVICRHQDGAVYARATDNSVLLSSQTAHERHGTVSEEFGPFLTVLCYIEICIDRLQSMDE